MIAFLVRRILQTIVILFMVSVFVFTIMHLLPGDPVSIMLGEDATPEKVMQVKQELGLDKSLPAQYVDWITKVLQGDLGNSISYQYTVNELISKRLPITLHIGVSAFLLSVIIGIPAGIIAAVKRGSPIDSLITVIANFGMAVPIFWLGILGIYMFSLKLGWLPVQGYTSPFEDFWKSFTQVIMPVILLSLVSVAYVTRQTRSAMLEVVRQDYIRTARSKGLKESHVILKHSLRNALIPVITILGIGLAHTVGGSIFIEQVFNIPGMGNLMIQAIFAKDYILVQGIVLIIASVVSFCNLLVDITYGYIDPRIRYK
ncbi:ABC transporter permease [Bacillus sp. Marseille-P3661]|uniref:ABC transporter permease n=1 Tax=Bacillus sp. Marseille-P3661 TaxID=1936234 RepID=UPI000C847EB3|nr:ABC transporter permease [Bacillus sp. Marseille-P3661]